MTNAPNEPAASEIPEGIESTEPERATVEVPSPQPESTESARPESASSELGGAHDEAPTMIGDAPADSPAPAIPSRPRYRPRSKVLVIGAGISGLTVAHELAIRDFEVTVVEVATAPTPKGMMPPKPVVPEPAAESDGPTSSASIPAPGEFDETLEIGGLAASQYHYGARHAKAFPQRQSRAATSAPLVGEHGYRFFPSYYQMLFDTMQRTPVFDASGRRTRFSTYDNIVSCSTQATVGTKEHPLLAIPRDPISSPLVGDMNQVLTEAGFRVTDVIYLAERMAQFMSSSPARRKIYEAISSYDFFVGIDKPDQKASIQYSAEADHELDYMPKVLAAFDGKYGDARTNIDNWAQMMLNFIEKLPKVDGILNGPTTPAWFRHWRLLLGELGVTFRRGELMDLTLDEGRTVATVDYLEGGGDGKPPARRTRHESPDYIVVATDAVTAQAVTRNLPQVGVPGGLRGFTTTVPPRVPPGRSIKSYDADRDDPGFRPPRHRPAPRNLDTAQRHVHTRDPEKSPGLEPWDRFQTLTGLQFYFDTEFELVKGRVYYGNSEWGLSSVSQTAYWTTKPSIENDGYHTIVSIDVGNATTKSRHTHKTFMESNADEIAEETWRQMVEALTVNHRQAAHTLPTPTWYTIDNKLVMGKNRVKRNKAPYLVPIMGDWDNRPGPEPWCPGGPSVPSPHQRRLRDEGVWQAGHGGSWIHWNNLVFAGTYLKTFTRLTTMESANESGRHAVNGIMDHWIAQDSDYRDRRAEKGLPWLVPYGYRGDFNSSPIRQPSPIGDYCLIVDMENNEVPALNPIRDLDAALVEKGLPHPFVLNGIQLNTSISSQIVALLSGEKTNYAPSTPSELLDKLRDYRRWLEGVLRGDYGYGDRPDHQDHGGHDPHRRHHDRHDPHGRHHDRPDHGGGHAARPGSGIDLLFGGRDMQQALDALNQLFGPSQRRWF